MIFFSHSSRIRILQLTFALVCSCSEGLLTTEKHYLVPFCLLIFCILCFSIQIKYFFFLDTQGTELKSVFHLLRLFYRQDRSSLPVSYKVLHIPTCLYRQFVITQTEFSQSYPVSYMSCSCSPLFSFLEGRFLLILLFLKFSALIRDEKHFARVQGSAINKPIIHIFSSAGRELATVKVYNMSSF